MSMHNLIEYSNNYSKTSGRLSQYYRDEPVLTYAGAIVNFHDTKTVRRLNINKK